MSGRNRIVRRPATLADLPEVLAMSNRILVMRAGTIAGELSRREATQERVLSLAIPPAGPTAGEAA